MIRNDTPMKFASPSETWPIADRAGMLRPGRAVARRAPDRAAEPACRDRRVVAPPAHDETVGCGAPGLLKRAAEGPVHVAVLPGGATLRDYLVRFRDIGSWRPGGASNEAGFLAGLSGTGRAADGLAEGPRDTTRAPRGCRLRTGRRMAGGTPPSGLRPVACGLRRDPLGWRSVLQP